MPKKDIKRIFIGIVFLIFSGISAVGAFYFIGFRPFFLDGKLVLPKEGSFSGQVDGIQDRPVIEDVSSNISRESPVVSFEEDSIISREESALLDLSYEDVSSISAGEGKNKKEGFLWVDSSSSQWIVTLGVVQGLSLGKYLNVYLGSQKVGEVVVDQIFENLSYVHPKAESTNLSVHDYYRVVLE